MQSDLLGVFASMPASKPSRMPPSMSDRFQRRRAFLGQTIAACAILAGVLLCSSASVSLHAQGQAPQGGALANTQYNKLQNSGPGGPAPKRDFTGSWAGPIQIDLSVVSPPLTPFGQKLLSENKPEAQYHVAD